MAGHNCPAIFICHSVCCSGFSGSSIGHEQQPEVERNPLIHRIGGLLAVFRPPARKCKYYILLSYNFSETTASPSRLCVYYYDGSEKAVGYQRFTHHAIMRRKHK